MDLQRIAKNIELRDDGFWAARSDTQISYPASGNEACFGIEDVSFWFRHRNHCILQAIHSYPPPGTFFDIGGGNGYVALAIQQAGYEVVLVEPGLAGVRNAATRGIHQIVKSTLTDAEFLPATIPSIGLFDVLEHVEDDGSFLLELYRLMAPGGRLYLTVPALPWLWSLEDTEAGHWRRYTLKSLTQVFTSSGFEVEFATSFFTFLPVPILVSRALPYRLGFRKPAGSAEAIRADHEVSNPLTARVLELLTNRELAAIASGRRYRRGGSCLLVACKPA